MKQTFSIIICVALVAIYLFTRNKGHNVESSVVPPPPTFTGETSQNQPIPGRHKLPDGTAQTAPKRTVASAVNLPANNSKERALLLDLIKTNKAAEFNPALRAKVQALRAQLNALPNKSAVIWDYYRDLQSANAPAFQRVEALDLLNGRGGDKQLSEVALAEALDFAPAETIRPENAHTEQERNIASTTDPSYIPVLVAFDIYLNNCGGYSDCQKGLLTVIANNDNHNMKASLIDAVNKQFPKSRNEFAADLSRYQLNQ